MKRLILTALFCALTVCVGADKLLDPVGNRISHDNIGSGTYVQRVKVQYGADGSAVDATTTRPLPVSFGNTGTMDAFGRVRVANPVGLFDSQLQYDKQPLLWQEMTTASATAVHQPNESSTLLSVAATINSSVTMQSRRYFRYQPGKSQLIVMTFVFDADEAGVTKRVGYFDDDNGIYLEKSGAALSIVLRSKATGTVVNTSIPQASWNIDPFDGTGASGVTLDGTLAQLFFINLEWLGSGRVRTGFFIDGLPVSAHHFLNANTMATVYMTTANLPLRYEIFNTTGAVTGTMRQDCSTVTTEGGNAEAEAFRFSANNSTTTVASATGVPLLSIRPKATFNSIVNRGKIQVGNFGVLANKDLLVELVFGGTLTGASFASVNASSIVEADTSASAVSGGIVLISTYIPAAGVGANAVGGAFRSLLSRVSPTLDKVGNHPTTPFTDAITLTGRSVDGTSANMYGHVDWIEIR